MCAPNTRTSNFNKETLLQLKTCLLSHSDSELIQYSNLTNRQIIQKKKITQRNPGVNIVNQIHLTDIYRKFHSTTKEYVLSSSWYFLLNLSNISTQTQVSTNMKKFHNALYPIWPLLTKFGYHWQGKQRKIHRLVEDEQLTHHWMKIWSRQIKKKHKTF